MTNEDVLNQIRSFQAVKLQPVWSCTGTNVDSFRQNEMTKITPNFVPTDSADFGRGFFHCFHFLQTHARSSWNHIVTHHVIHLLEGGQGCEGGSLGVVSVHQIRGCNLGRGVAEFVHAHIRSATLWRLHEIGGRACRFCTL